MNELADFPAVPNLGRGVMVQAPAAQLASFGGSAAHAGLCGVEVAHQGFSFGFVCSLTFVQIILVLHEELPASVLCRGAQWKAEILLHLLHAIDNNVTPSQVMLGCRLTVCRLGRHFIHG